MDLPIIYEDNYLLAVNKPAGLQVGNDKFGNPSLESIIADYLKKNYNWKKQLITGVVHRLDRPVSGLVLFAKTPMALKNIRASFESGTIDKIYLAVTENIPELKNGELVHWLFKDNENRRSNIVNPHSKGSKEAKLIYKVLEEQQGRALLNIKLLTGRYHQIRAQLSAIGCPVYGDVKYGSITPLPGESILLHSSEMQIKHPKSGEILKIKAPTPPWKVWQEFKNWSDS